MKFKERLEKFLELQNRNMSFEDISKELEISPSTLRSFLNKRGYKWSGVRYVLKEDEKNNSSKIKEVKKDDSVKSTAKTIKSTSKTSKVITKKSNTKIESKKDAKTKIKKDGNTKTKVKKDRKINISQEDLDKLCEVYDWYLEVKDNRAMKPKSNKSNKKDIKVEQTNINDLKSTSIRVDKKVWEDFERLCSNSQYTKQEIITQALKDFMKEYKNLL